MIGFAGHIFHTEDDIDSHCLQAKNVFCGNRTGAIAIAVTTVTSNGVMVFKRNAHALSLNAIVDVRLRRYSLRRHDFFRISRKLVELATSKLTKHSPR